MRIAVFLEELTAGGVERTTLRLAGGFLSQGHAVDLLLLRQGGLLEAEVPAGVRVVPLQKHGPLATRMAVFEADPGGLLQLARPVLLAKRGRLAPILFHLKGLCAYLHQARPDVLLSTGLWPNLCSVWARERTRVATGLVLTVRSSMVEYAHSRRREERRALMHRYYPRADRIVTVSRDLAAELHDFADIPEQRITAIYNAVVDDDLYAAAREEADHPWLKPDEPPVILGVGRLVPRKGFDVLLRAFARVRRARPARLIILGHGKTSGEGDVCMAELKALARELGIVNDVSLPGFRRNPFAYMARAAVFVLPSRFEGLPGVLIQAMACGCPVVSTDCPTGPREILEGGKYGPLVPVDDDGAMAAAIERVLDEQRRPVVEPAALAPLYSTAAATRTYLDLFREISPLVPNSVRARPTSEPPQLSARLGRKPL